MSYSPPKFTSDVKTGKFVYSVDDFTQVGQNSYDTPPSQDPGQFSKLQDVLPVTRGGLRRRRGYSNFLTGNGTTPYFLGSGINPHMFNFQRDSDSLREIVTVAGGNNTSVGGVNDAVIVSAFSDAGIFTGLIPGFSSPPRMVTSRNYGYFTSGTQGDTLKWDGGSVVNKWGIDVSAGLASVQVTSAPTVGSGGTKWTGAANAFVEDATYAQTVIGASQTDNLLTLSDFGFTIPANSKILDIKITVTATSSHAYPSPGQGSILYYTLTKAGVIYGTNWSRQITNTNLTTTDSPGLWGGSWTSDDINGSGFGVTIHAANLYDDHASNTFYIDNVALTVTYTPSTSVAVAIGSSGNVSLTVGRIYYCAFQNSITGHLSDLNAASNSCGPCSNKQVSLTSIPVSGDDQVDTKVILSTSDGGDPSILYLISELSNASTTFSDNIAEQDLVLNQQYLFTDDFGNDFGLAGNTPPPPHAHFCIKHRGRLWMLEGQNLFFSKSVADLTLPNGFIAGKYEESWPADNYFDVSEGAELGTGILSDGQTLYIGTERHVLRLLGDDPTNFIEPEIVHPEAGVLNQEVWQLTFLEGTPAGSIWMTPDNKVIQSNFSSYQDIGTPIQDILNSVNKVSAQTVCRAQYFSDGPLNLYILAIPTGANIYPDTLCVFNLKTRMWVIWTLQDAVQSLLFSPDASGVPRWLFAGEGFCYLLSASSTQDVHQNLDGSTVPTGISCIAQTSWMEFGSPNYRKLLDEIEFIGDPDVTVTVYGASAEAEFTTATPLVTDRPLTVGPFGTLKCYLYTAPTKYRFYMFRFKGIDNTSDTFMDGYTLTGAYFNSL